MDQSVKKFLEFNGKTIYFLAKGGAYWVAIKPICEALNINFDRQYKNIKSHQAFSQLYANQPMTGADNKTYKMVSLPERYVYGWIFQIRSESKELISYQKQCCDILFDYFHGSITSRETLIQGKTKDQLEVERLEITLSSNSDFQKLQETKAKIKAINGQLRLLDTKLQQEQLELFK